MAEGSRAFRCSSPIFSSSFRGNEREISQDRFGGLLNCDTQITSTERQFMLLGFEDRIEMESLSWKSQCYGFHTLPKAGLLVLQRSKDQQNPIFHYLYRLLNNSMMLEQMFVEVLQGPDEMMEDSSYSSACNSRKSEFDVGTENSIRNVKELLFQSHVSVVCVKGMGGAGKTTLALSVSNDPQIKGYFGNNILFFTVSWFPNVKRILGTMWHKIVGRGRSEFQPRNRCLETGIDFLADIARECFLDLAAFPEERKICVEALLHVWVYVRKLEWNDAFVVLMELANRNLLHLTSNSGSCPTISSGDVSDLYFYQHDVVRDLALHLGCQESLLRRKRLVMPRKEHSLPVKWELLNNKAFGAQIVSIHTGSMNENHWFEMNFPETEALMLHMTASDYFLPPFLTSMKKLKVLMVYNYGSERATLKGLDSLSSLTQLKSVRLERLIAPPVLKQTSALPNLEKLSLSLCEGFRNISSFDNTNISLKLPKLQDFNIDHCSELEELPSFMFDMPSARTRSITNCHQVEKLSSELGNLSSLVVLRLSALPGLKELPPSIGKLTSLEYLDISFNECLEELPQETGQLKRLKKINMRECPRLRKLPRTVCGLTSLTHVICDEQLGNQWLRLKSSTIPHLRVEIVEERFSLDWLDD